MKIMQEKAFYIAQTCEFKLSQLFLKELSMKQIIVIFLIILRFPLFAQYNSESQIVISEDYVTFDEKGLELRITPEGYLSIGQFQYQLFSYDDNFWFESGDYTSIMYKNHLAVSMMIETEGGSVSHYLFANYKTGDIYDAGMSGYGSKYGFQRVIGYKEYMLFIGGFTIYCFSINGKARELWYYSWAKREEYSFKNQFASYSINQNKIIITLHSRKKIALDLAKGNSPQPDSRPQLGRTGKID